MTDNVQNSPPGGAEVAARRTAAAALLADYQRAAQTADVAERAMWGARLADALVYLLAAPPAGLPPAQLATVLDALDFAADELRDRVANCGDCDQHPAGLCETCANRLARAEGWDKTAGALRGQR